MHLGSLRGQNSCRGNMVADGSVTVAAACYVAPSRGKGGLGQGLDPQPASYSLMLSPTSHRFPILPKQNRQLRTKSSNTSARAGRVTGKSQQEGE